MVAEQPDLLHLKKYALIVAGGSGLRMGSDIPKQFLLINGLPILMHTINAFSGIQNLHILLVLPESQIEFWKNLCNKFSFSVQHRLVIGGETRFHSVRNGLQHINDGLVAIHDGVRPVISKDIIEKSFSVAASVGNAVAAVKLKDSIRELTITGNTKNVNRNNYFIIQTPQTFKIELIKQAYLNATHYNFTDDAGVLEEVSKIKINLIDGDYKNIKVTTPEDIEIAAVFLKTKKD